MSNGTLCLLPWLPLQVPMPSGKASAPSPINLPIIILFLCFLLFHTLTLALCCFLFSPSLSNSLSYALRSTLRILTQITKPCRRGWFASWKKKIIICSMNNLITILDETKSNTYRSSTILISFRWQFKHHQNSREELPPFLGSTILHGGISSRFAWKQPFSMCGGWCQCRGGGRGCGSGHI